MYLSDSKPNEIKGRIHLGISQIVYDSNNISISNNNQNDKEVTLSSGLEGGNLKFRTNTVRDKIEWTDAITQCQMQHKIKRKIKRAIRNKVKVVMEKKKENGVLNVSKDDQNQNIGFNGNKKSNLNEIAMNFPTNVFSNSSKYVQSVKSTKKL
jgi:predicted SPOUT superfamily RNA methylase MTH1